MAPASPKGAHTVCLAKCKNRKNMFWPARICDADEVDQHLAGGADAADDTGTARKAGPKPSVSASDEDMDPRNNVLVQILCESGHNYLDWIQPDHIKRFAVGYGGGNLADRTGLVDYQAAECLAAKLLECKAEEEEIEAKVRAQRVTLGLPALDTDSASKGAELRMHRYNREAFNFYDDQLECPWRCKECNQHTASCGCEKGLTAYITDVLTKGPDKKKKKGTSARSRGVNRYVMFRCPVAVAEKAGINRSKKCMYCNPPGQLIYMVEWGKKDFVAVADQAFAEQARLEAMYEPVDNKPTASPPTSATRLRVTADSGSGSGSSGESGGDSSMLSSTRRKVPPAPQNPAAPPSGAGAGAGAAGGAVGGVGTKSSSSRHSGPLRIRRCNQCEGCTAPNCGECWACKDMVFFGGRGTRRQPCVLRWCREKARMQEEQRQAFEDQQQERRARMAAGKPSQPPRRASNPTPSSSASSRAAAAAATTAAAEAEAAAAAAAAAAASARGKRNEQPVAPIDPAASFSSSRSLRAKRPRSLRLELESDPSSGPRLRGSSSAAAPVARKVAKGAKVVAAAGGSTGGSSGVSTGTAKGGQSSPAGKGRKGRAAAGTGTGVGAGAAVGDTGAGAEAGAGRTGRAGRRKTAAQLEAEKRQERHNLLLEKLRSNAPPQTLLTEEESQQTAAAAKVMKKQAVAVVCSAAKDCNPSREKYRDNEGNMKVRDFLTNGFRVLKLWTELNSVERGGEGFGFPMCSVNRGSRRGGGGGGAERGAEGGRGSKEEAAPKSSWLQSAGRQGLHPFAKYDYGVMQVVVPKRIVSAVWAVDPFVVVPEIGARMVSGLKNNDLGLVPDAPGAATAVRGGRRSPRGRGSAASPDTVTDTVTAHSSSSEGRGGRGGGGGELALPDAAKRLPTNFNGKARRKSSSYRGVSLQKKKWVARIRRPRTGDDRTLGHYDTEMEAARAYDAVAKIYYKDKATLNFTDDVDAGEAALAAAAAASAAAKEDEEELLVETGGERAGVKRRRVEESKDAAILNEGARVSGRGEAVVIGGGAAEASKTEGGGQGAVGGGAGQGGGGVHVSTEGASSSASPPYKGGDGEVTLLGKNQSMEGTEGKKTGPVDSGRGAAGSDKSVAGKSLPSTEHAEKGGLGGVRPAAEKAHGATPSVVAASNGARPVVGPNSGGANGPCEEKAAAGAAHLNGSATAPTSPTASSGAGLGKSGAESGVVGAEATAMDVAADGVGVVGGGVESGRSGGGDSLAADAGGDGAKGGRKGLVPGQALLSFLCCQPPGRDISAVGTDTSLRGGASQWSLEAQVRVMKQRHLVESIMLLVQGATGSRQVARSKASVAKARALAATKPRKGAGGVGRAAKTLEREPESSKAGIARGGGKATGEGGGGAVGKTSAKGERASKWESSSSGGAGADGSNKEQTSSGPLSKGKVAKGGAGGGAPMGMTAEVDKRSTGKEDETGAGKGKKAGGKAPSSSSVSSSLVSSVATGGASAARVPPPPPVASSSAPPRPPSAKSAGGVAAAAVAPAAPAPATVAAAAATAAAKTTAAPTPATTTPPPPPPAAAAAAAAAGSGSNGCNDSKERRGKAAPSSGLRSSSAAAKTKAKAKVNPKAKANAKPQAKKLSGRSLAAAVDEALEILEVTHRSLQELLDEDGAAVKVALDGALEEYVARVKTQVQVLRMCLEDAQTNCVQLRQRRTAKEAHLNTLARTLQMGGGLAPAAKEGASASSGVNRVGTGGGSSATAEGGGGGRSSSSSSRGGDGSGDNSSSGKKRGNSSGGGGTGGAQVQSLLSSNSAQLATQILAAEWADVAKLKEEEAEMQEGLKVMERDLEAAQGRLDKKLLEARDGEAARWLKEREGQLRLVAREWDGLRAVLKRQLESSRTLLLSDSACREHLVPPEKLERPKRMDEAVRAISFTSQALPLETHVKDFVDSEWLDMIFPNALLKLAHSVTYVARLQDRIAKAGTSWECLTADDMSDDEDPDSMSGKMNRDTVGNQRSWAAAQAAAGSVIEAIDRVLFGRAHNAFCAVRPPGHHAGIHLHCMGAVSNGFCLINNVALGAMYAHHHRGLGRIAVVDFDVHHGNGTQDVLCRTYHPSFLYASIHAHGWAEQSAGGMKIFPGTGGTEVPTHDHVLNLPISGRVTPSAFHRATTTICEALDRFRPDLILLSSGFDAHQADPSKLGMLEASDFGIFTRRMVNAAERLCCGRLVSVLEGGYALDCTESVQAEGLNGSLAPGGGNPFAVKRVKHAGTDNPLEETLSDCIEAHVQALVDGVTMRVRKEEGEGQ